MNFEFNAGEKAKCLKVWEKPPTNIEIVNEIFKNELPESYEAYVFRFENRVELWQDLFLLSDKGAEKVEKLVNCELVEVRVPARDAELVITKSTVKSKEKNRGFER